MTLLKIEEPPQPPSAKQSLFDHPVLRLGFRPFYLLAAGFAVLAIGLWMARYFDWIGPFGNVGLVWHLHEMIFGFVIAVIIGFLYTAGRNWTGLWTPTKKHLALLALLWVAGRLAMLTAGPLLAAVVDMLFLPLAAWPLYVVLQRSGNTRNMFLIGLLGLLTLANAAFHGAVLGWLAISPIAPVHAAILIIVLLESVIAGRIIPGFTANVIAGVKPLVHKRQDAICMAFTAIACAAWIFGLPALLTASLAFAAACAQLLRLVGWKPLATLQHPLLWILHLSYAWIPAGFILLALSAIDQLPSSAAFHVLAIGSMAGLIIGMMTRTTLGHTGRPLSAGKSEVVMYALLQIGVLSRLIAAFQTGPLRDAALLITTLAWMSAFLLYLVVYSAYLTQPRIDGKEG